jgi:O-antigen ligase
LKKEITTPHFDWGYLEIWTELGIVGLLIWLIFLLYILKITVHKSDFAFSGIVALMIINITSPAVFHLLGILILAVIASQFDKKIEK